MTTIEHPDQLIEGRRYRFFVDVGESQYELEATFLRLDHHFRRLICVLHMDDEDYSIEWNWATEITPVEN